MNASLEVGLEFEGIGGMTESISSEFEYSFKRTVTDITEISSTETISFNCGANDG